MEVEQGVSVVFFFPQFPERLHLRVGSRRSGRSLHDPFRDAGPLRLAGGQLQKVHHRSRRGRHLSFGCRGFVLFGSAAKSAPIDRTDE